MIFLLLLLLLLLLLGVVPPFATPLTIITNDIFSKGHMGPAEHPERPKRTQVVVESLSQLQNVRVEKLSLTPPAREKAERALRSVHAEWYLDEIKAPRTRRSLLDGADTFITVDSWDVVLAATHAWIEAVEHAAAGEVAFAVARPPGHHATKAGAMGFCLANFAAAAARYAADTLGLSRVAILDWDVHYGNGIYNIVRDDPRIHYCSIHQGGIFPGTGDANECGPLRNIKPLPVYEVGMTWKGGYERIFKVGCPSSDLHSTSYYYCCPLQFVFPHSGFFLYCRRNRMKRCRG
jgi:acetoin utilization deacetylase AcuC-like enzyme